MGLITLLAEVLDYNPAGLDLARVEPVAMRYELFLGNVAVVGDAAEFRADWGWVPALDFAACFRDIAYRLDGRGAQFEFTESEAVIDFSFDSGVAELTSNVFDGRISTTRSSLCEASDLLIGSLLEDIVHACPRIARNPHFMSLTF